jgi:hypothetical protein
VSISDKVIVSSGNAALTTTGFALAAGGKSHSWETPTRLSPAPRAKTISVAAGRNEMRRVEVMAVPQKAFETEGTEISSS